MREEILSFILGAGISLVLGPIVIPMLKKLYLGQSIREDGPKTHLIKSGTPTIGGIIFLISILMTNIILRNFSPDVFIIFLSALGFAAIGFLDDYIKVSKKRNLGLRAYQKLLVQILIALMCVIYQINSKNLTHGVILPFSKELVNFSVFYIPFIVFVVVGTVNSVNLTDGLDGLSSGVSIICLAFFAAASYKLKRYDIMLFCLSFMGALLGFLYFNKYPAKVFMGDTGSLAIGGIISAIAIILNLPIALIVAGGIYVIETLSVIIQVISFKTTGRRVFKMSPLHHHFEQLGYSEVQVVIGFYIAQIILSIVAYIIFI